MRYKFTIDGPLLGYRASVARAFDPRYKAFKARVRILATQAGVPMEIGPKEYARVCVTIAWKNKARIDAENVTKAILDALWKQDRRVFDIHTVANEKLQIETAHVEIKVMR